MAYPEISVSLALTVGPFNTPVWTDVSAYVRQRVTVRRGRADQFAEFRAGTAVVTLSNRDRRFDPDITSGPYGANLLPMKQIQILADWDGTAHRLFTGYVLSYTMRYENGGVAYADIECVDGSEPLSRLQLGTPDVPLELAEVTGAVQAGSVLDEVGWPAGKRTIDSGASYLLQGSVLDGVPALEYLQLIARSVDGQFFIGRQGNAILQGWAYRGALSSVGIWGDVADGSELPYLDFDTSYSADGIWNRAEIMREGGILQVADDTPSQTAYLVRTISRTGLLLVDDADALSIANGIVDVYNDPRVRARSLRPQPHVGDTWDEVLGREISDRITVRRETLLGGSVTELDCFIEGIGITIERTADRWDWNVEWYLSSI